MRPIVSYDDITLPYEDPTPVAGSPPTKKRKNNDAKAHPVHPKDDEDSVVDLTHEEIWDDSALIDAWNSAQAEYAVCNYLRLSHTILHTFYRHSMAETRTVGRINQ